MNTAMKMRLPALLAALAGLAAAPLALAEVTAKDAWARATTPGAKVAAAYVTFTNSGSEERNLLKIVTPVADEITLHRTTITAEGTARMWPLSGLSVEGGQTVRMDPGGVHVMLNKLTGPLVAGQKFPLTIKFDGGEPEFTVMVEVRPLVPAADEHAHHH